MIQPTLNQILLDALRRHAKPELLWHKQGGRWVSISTEVFLSRVASLAEGLQRLGIGKGDRVGLFSENRPEWHIADLAILGVGAINVPIYPAESVERLRYILQHSEARLCFVSGPEQFGKVSVLWNELPQLEKVVAFSGVDASEGGSAQRVLAWEAVVRDDVPAEQVAAFERMARSQGREDVATLIYTSGTTGTPKGVLLTQGNFASNVVCCMARLHIEKVERALSILPLCHIYERTNAYVYMAHGITIAYAESFDKVVENLREVKPETMAAVPRFFEKLYAGILNKVEAAPAAARRLFDWAIRVGKRARPYRLAQKPLPTGLRWRYGLADWLVYRRVRGELGGRIRYFVSGSAPLARGANEFLHAAGLTIYEGYGLTETSPVIAVNVPGAVKLGTVGRPIDGVEVKIAEDGEILTRGPHVMKGYYKMEEETRAALEDGWFHTGDVGYLDPDGFLVITDRKKDLIKTAGGKYVAPQPIENLLKQSPYIQNAVVVGDRRRFVVALLVPDFARLEQFAEAQGIAYRSKSELATSPAVHALLAGEVESVNHHLAQYERLKRFAVLADDFSFDNGQLTYTQKVRRRQVEELYGELIEQLYRDEAPPAATA